MRKLFPVLAGLVLLAACGDPTQKHDYGCTGEFGSGAAKQQACVQFHITEVEGNVAQQACQQKGGTWAYHACDTTNEIPGYCQVDSASSYSLSGTPASVFFYSPATETEASAACVAGGGQWHSPGT